MKTNVIETKKVYIPLSKEWFIEMFNKMVLEETTKVINEGFYKYNDKTKELEEADINYMQDIINPKSKLYGRGFPYVLCIILSHIYIGTFKAKMLNEEEKSICVKNLFSKIEINIHSKAMEKSKQKNEGLDNWWEIDNKYLYLFEDFNNDYNKLINECQDNYDLSIIENLIKAKINLL